MSDRKIRRFTSFQVVSHWVVAIPYLVLICTGALLILRRLGFLNRIPGTTLSTIHRWAGITLIVFLLQLLIASIVGGHIRPVLSDLAEWCRFRGRDLLWIVMVPLNILFPRRFRLPPTGRYNAGQKLHGVFIVCGITTFAITGLLIIFRPADIRPWIIHSWLFFGAIAFLAIHLFLGLINPPTRRALPGIFTGHVSFQYIQDHHALILTPVPEPSHAHAVVSLLAVILTALIVVSGVSGLVWYYGPQRSQQKFSTLARLEHPMVSPGPLAKSHANDPRTASCEVCHESLKPPSSPACLTCHSEIATVMQQKTGFHGQLQGECRTCHADHRGPDADLRGLSTVSFNHQQARFHLDGKHESLQCDQCHVEHSTQPGERRFVGLQFTSCSDCHVSPHESIAALDCTKCHTAQGWKGDQLVFNHQRDTNFPLKGQHASLDCAQCHSPLRATPAVQPALTAVSSGAIPLGIKPMPQTETVAHQTVKFRLTDVGSNCADCHVDPHGGQFENQSCSTCHSEQGWKGKALVFDHNRDASFKLDAIHQKVDCASCHAPTAAVISFRSLSSSCEQCHAPVSQAMAGNFMAEVLPADPHNGRVSCTECHSPNIVSPAAQDFAQACVKCHNPRYRDLFFEWQKSLDEHLVSAQNAIARLKADDPKDSDALGARLSEARRTGLHNINAAIKTLDEIAADHTQPPVKNDH